MLVKVHVAIREDPDQTACKKQSDKGLCCLSIKHRIKYPAHGHTVLP